MGERYHEILRWAHFHESVWRQARHQHQINAIAVMLINTQSQPGKSRRQGVVNTRRKQIMMSRSQTTDRELLLILITLLLLAYATQFGNASHAGEVVVATSPTTALDRAATAESANPYWAPAHAFSRRLEPVYSDATREATPRATQE
jgi:hypothetical protein